MKNKIVFFNILCFVLILFVGVSFVVPKNEMSRVNADAENFVYADDGVMYLTSYYTNYENGLPWFSDDNRNSSVGAGYCLRDDYYLYTQNQNPKNVCWAFAGNMSLATTLMKGTNQFYDFSDGWVSTAFGYVDQETATYPGTSVNHKYYIGLSTATDYVVGGGATFIFYDRLVRTYGVVLESDYSFEEFAYANEENAKYHYNHFSQYANKNIFNNIQTGRFKNYNESVNSSQKNQILNSMKYHVKNYGSINLSMNWGTTSTTTKNGQSFTYKVPGGGNGGHAVSIIGWDDNFQVGSYKGAWIVLNSWANSWGNNGIFYCFYDDTDMNDFFGYRYVENSNVQNSTNLQFNAKLTASSNPNENYKTNFKGLYYGSYARAEAQTKQENVIYGNSLNNFTIDYTLSSGAKIDEVCVYLGDEDVSPEFSKIDTSAKGKIVLSAENLRYGTYKILTTCSDADEEKIYLNNIFIMGAEESDYIYVSGTNLYTKKNYYISYNDYVASNAIDIGVKSKTGSITLYFYKGTYSNITNATLVGDAKTSQSVTNYTTYLSINLGYNIGSGTVASFAMTLTGSDGTTTTKTINLIYVNTTNQTLTNVYFNTNGGKNDVNNLSKIAIPSSGYVQINEPTRKGYKFEGWFKDKNFTASSSILRSGSYQLQKSDINTVSAPTSDSNEVYNTFGSIYEITLYAKWTELKNQVTYVFNNGESNKVESVADDSLLPVPATPSRTGYTFVGWYRDSSFSQEWNFTTDRVTEDITLYAKWQINQYSVKFNYNVSGVNPLLQTKNYNSKLVAPAGVENVGHTFIGWFKDITLLHEWDFENDRVTGNTILYAKWQVNTYTVTYDYNFDISGMNPTTESVDYNNKANGNNPTLTGYTFIGWYKDKEFTQAWNFLVDKVTQNITLFAKWQINTYKVTYYYDNGETPREETIQFNSLLEKTQDPEKNGFAFGGWYKNVECTQVWDFDNDKITSDTSLYAKWLNLFKVTYDFNDGSNITQEVNDVVEGTKLIAPAYTRTGYTLAEWRTAPSMSDGNVWNFDEGINESITLYAIWNLNAPTNVKLVLSSDEDIETYTQFTLTLTYSHEISPNYLNVFVTLYRNGEIVSGSENYNGTILTDKLLVAGTYEYSATYTLIHGGNSIIGESEKLIIDVKAKQISVNNIKHLGNAKFTWNDEESNALYIVALNKMVADGFEQVYITQQKNTTKQVDFWDKINDVGNYFITIEQYKGENVVGSINSEIMEVVWLNYVTKTTAEEFEPKLVCVGFKIEQPNEISRDGYVFANWCKDQDLNLVWDFAEMVIEEETTLYASWKLEDITITLEELVNFETNDNKITATYEKGIGRIIEIASSHKVYGTYSYKWLKKVSDEYQGTDKNDKRLSLKEPKDSGTYICEVTFVDGERNSVTTRSQEFIVEIDKAETKINTANVVKELTYNGEEQIINNGARVVRTEDYEIDFQYTNNRFKDVPESGELIVEIYAPETALYKEGRTTVVVKINKKRATIIASRVQTFKYNGSVIMPNYTLDEDNLDAVVVCSREIKNVDSYKNILLTVKESKNYLETTTVVDVKVKKSTIVIKAKNVTSFWFFDIKKLGSNDYEVTGDYEGQPLDVTISTNADKMKFGTYDIFVSFDDPNYDVTIINGNYEVSGIPHFVGLGVLFVLIIWLIIVMSRRRYSFDFESNGGEYVASINTKNKDKVVLISPEREGYEFGGWYYDEELSVPYDNKVKKGKTKTLYAKWDKVDKKKKQAEKHSEIHNILRDLNIVKDEPVVNEIIDDNLNANIQNDKSSNDVPKEKTEAEKMMEIINSAMGTGADMSNEDLKRFIDDITDNN